MRNDNLESDALAGAPERDAGRCAEVAGVAAAFGRVLSAAPGLVALQQALLAGAARADEREAERLAVRDGNDPRRVRALAKADESRRLGEDIGRAEGAVRRIWRGRRRGTVFHGYVLTPEGGAVAGHLIRVEGEVGEKSNAKLEGKTDDTGYFEIEFDIAGQAEGSVGVGKFAAVGRRDRARQRKDARQNLEVPASAAQNSAQSTEETDTSVDERPVRIYILDGAGRVVHADPKPPGFDERDSIFRVYSVEGGKGGPGGPGGSSATAATEGFVNTGAPRNRRQAKRASR
jgi:hypothetical protein